MGTTSDFGEYVDYIKRHGRDAGAFCYNEQGTGASLQVYLNSPRGGVGVFVTPSHDYDAVSELPPPVDIEYHPTDEFLERVLHHYRAYTFVPGDDSGVDGLEYTGC